MSIDWYIAALKQEFEELRIKNERLEAEIEEWEDWLKSCFEQKSEIMG